MSPNQWGAFVYKQNTPHSNLVVVYVQFVISHCEFKSTFIRVNVDSDEHENISSITSIGNTPSRNFSRTSSWEFRISFGQGNSSNSSEIFDRIVIITFLRDLADIHRAL